MLPTPADAVRAHIRAVSLSALQRAIALGGDDSDKLRGVSSQVAERACFDVSFRIWAAQVVICGHMADSAVALKFLSSARDQAHSVSYLSKSSALDQIVGPLHKHLSTDAELVQNAWMLAEKTLQELGLSSLSNLFRAVDLVAGFHGVRGEIRALSNPCFPGFVAIGIDAPPLIITEQALHESMHVVVSARLAISDELAELLDERVGVLSPFTNSVRTIERVVHGILSYSVVGALWRAVACFSTPGYFLEISDRDHAQGVAERRVRTIEARLRLAMQCLLDGAGVEACRRTAQLLEELTDLTISYLPSHTVNRRKIVVDAGYSTGLVGLSAIERAEVTAATSGAKASRISVSLVDIPRIGFALAACAPVAASSWAIRSVRDPRLNGFSNVSSDSKHILDAEPGSEVHLYLHPDATIARKAAMLDGKDEAGELFEIPNCCRDWYARAWPDTRTAGGDLFATMVRRAATNGRVTVASECDASAMYRGGGLCWHFPCSPNCTETVRISRNRRRLFEESDPNLLRELDRAKRCAITILADGSYRDGATDGDGSIIVTFC